jgi:hypothetical protein
MNNLINTLDRATEFIQNTWTSVVRGDGQTLGAPSLRFDTITQRNIYADSIVQGTALDMPEAGEFTRKIIATAPIAEKTEKGYTAWDMKPMLLNGPKARISKKGTVFNIIPFRHGTSDKSGENAQFRPMPKDIYAAAKNLAVSLTTKQSMAGAGQHHILKYGGKLTGTNWDGKYPNQVKVIGLREPVGIVVGRGGYQHKSSIYEGMLKIQANYGAKSQNKYLTFRVVSEKSHPLSWWHPGRPAQPHVQFVVDYCMPAIERNIKQAVQLDFLVFQGLGMDIRVG